MRAKIMIMVKEPVVRQEGEGARGLNVHREVVGARPFIAQIEIPKSNLVGTEAQVEKSILTNKHLDLKRSCYMTPNEPQILSHLKIQTRTVQAFIVMEVDCNRRRREHLMRPASNLGSGQFFMDNRRSG